MFVDAIIGGEYVTNPRDYPWMVQVISYDKNSNACGGSIISENIILTAAHCVKHGSSLDMDVARGLKKPAIAVKIGHSSLKHSIIVNVKSKLIHPYYFDTYPNSTLYDIALLELYEDLKFNEEIQPIALPDEAFEETNYLNKSRFKFMVAGWGVTFDIPNDFYPLLKSNKWTLHKSKIPKQKYLKFCGIPESIKCDDNIKLKPNLERDTLKVTEVNCVKFTFGSSNAKKKIMPFRIHAMSTKPYIPGPCNGDSGGPLMKLDFTTGKYEVVGIVSSTGRRIKVEGPNGCLGPTPAVYTGVAAFVPWIKASNPDSFMRLECHGWSCYFAQMLYD